VRITLVNVESMTSKTDLPSSKKMVWPIIEILQAVPDSVPKATIDSRLEIILGLTDEQVSLRHDASRAEYSYRSAWALSYGKKAGYFSNPKRNHWEVTDKGRLVKSSSDVIV
jgi:restriction system protein